MITEYGTDVPGLAIVRSARGWARDLHRYVVDYGGAVVRTRPLEERQALEDTYDVLIVDDISSFLNAHIVEEVQRRGRRVLGVYDPEEFSPAGERDSGRLRLERLGVDGVIEADASPEDFIRIIRKLAPVSTNLAIGTAPDDLSGLFAPLDSPLGTQPISAAGNVLRPTQLASNGRPKGHITAVFAAAGGSGSTEVALELARSLGRRGEKTVLVDGDELAPSLAQRLNLALHPNLRTAVDVVEHGTGRMPDCLIGIASGLEVLVGIPHPRDWVELRGQDITAVVNELARGRAQIVVNASPFIEDLTPFGTADRFGMSRAVVAAADTIVLVCPPTPMGIARLIDRVAEIEELAQGKPVHIVVNRMQSSKFKRKEIAREIERSINPASIHFVAADHRVENASWDGTLVRNGEFTRAIGSSVTAVIPQVLLSKKRSRKNAAPSSPRGAHTKAAAAARKGA